MHAIADLIPFIPLLLAAGIAAGLIAGLLGAGGGIVMVPILFYIMGAMGVVPDVRMHTAVGTSLAVIVVTSVSSVYSHYRRGAVDVHVLRSWAPYLLLGAVAGAALANVLSPDFLTFVFGLFALLFAVQMGFDLTPQNSSEELPKRILKLVLVGGNGLVSALLGIGGGMIGVSTLTYYRFPIHRAIATAAGFGALISIPGAIGFVMIGWGRSDLAANSLGFVNWGLFALVAPVTVAAAPFGARLAHLFDRTTLRRIFAVLMALTAIRMISDVV